MSEVKPLNVSVLAEVKPVDEKKVDEMLKEALKGLNKKTCIIITHKAAALEVCDKEFVIDNKRLFCIYKNNG